MNAGNYSNKGFTLIELLVSMTILSLVIGVIVEALWTGRRSWERSRDVISHEVRLRSVVDLVTKQVRSAIPLHFKGDEKKSSFYGNSEFLGFITTLPLGIERRSGLFYVKYLLEEDPLDGLKVMKIYQRPVYTRTPSEMEVRKDGVVLLRRIRDLSWAYFSNGEWTDEWSDEQDALPRMVRLSFHYADEESDDGFEVIIPIMAFKDGK